jgi:FHS family L-fucose permease-like MFS transporter
MATAPARSSNRSAFVSVTALFCMRGFITCMNDLLVPKFKADFNLTRLQANLVQSAI